MEFIRERNFDSKGVNLTAKEWGRSGYLPVIALHGWLDNAASFDRMLPYMKNLHVVAPDLAGHGPSGHRSEDSGYDIWSDIADVMAVADQMGWDTFALLGHSRGAIIAGLVSGTFPDRISHAVLIDGYVPTPVDDGNSAKQLAKAIHENKRFGQASPTAFRDFDHAVQARTSGILPLEPEAAAILAARGVVLARSRDGGSEGEGARGDDAGQRDRGRARARGRERVGGARRAVRADWRRLFSSRRRRQRRRAEV